MADANALFDEFDPVSIEEWNAKVVEETGRSALDDFLDWRSIEGVSVPAYLNRRALDDVEHVAPDAPLPPLAGRDGSPANRWIICQRVDHPRPKRANELARQALKGGATDLLFAENLRIDGESRRALNSVADVATALEGIDLDEAGIHFENGPTSTVWYAAFRAYLRGIDQDPTVIRGSVGYDPVAAVAAGDLFTVDSAFDLAASLRTDAADMPNFETVTVDASVYHDAGASAVQEVAFVLGALTERIAQSTERGASLPELLDELQIRVPVSTSYFVEIGKLRALRLLVAQVIEAFQSEGNMRGTYAPADLHVHAQTSRRTETTYDPHANMLRGSTEALAAVVGGCDVLTVRRFDAAFREPDSFGTRIARNTQLVLQHEAHAHRVADPVAGSYYLETLTDQLAARAWERFQQLEAGGGIVAALRDGTIQADIEETRRKRQRALNEREQVLVGTSHYPDLDERRSDDISGKGATARIDGASASVTVPQATIESIGDALREGHSVPQIIQAVRGSGSEIAPLRRFRLAADIEAIRLRTEEYSDAHNGPPTILLVPMGPPSVRSSRANFARNFLGVGGFQIEEPLKFDAIEEATQAATEHDADVVVLCSSNSEYTDLAPALDSALKERNHDAILGIAGSPDDVDAGGSADFFVHRESPLSETLEDLQARLGISGRGSTP